MKNPQKTRFKTALAGAAIILIIVIAASCSPFDSDQETVAPITAQCLAEAYSAHRQFNYRDSLTLAVITCTNRQDVQAELQEIPADLDDVAGCQKRQQRRAPKEFPYRLQKTYAAIVCIR